MKTIQKGFTLIEVLLATALAGIVSVFLMQMISRINSTQHTLDVRMSAYVRATLIQNQLDRDMNGATMFTEYDYSASQQKTNQEQDQETDSSPDPEESKNQIDKTDKTDKNKSDKKKPELKYPMQLFVATSQEGQLGELTFFSTNPVQSYWGLKAGKARPKIVRITYRLVPEEKVKQPSYRLTRQEVLLSPLGESNKSIASDEDKTYTLAEGIRDMTVKYGWFEHENINKSEQASSDNKETEKASQIPSYTYQYHTASQWTAPERPRKASTESIADKRGTDDSEYNPQPVIPSYIEIRISFWDTTRQKATTFEFRSAGFGYYGIGTASKQEHDRIVREKKTGTQSSEKKPA